MELKNNFYYLEPNDLEIVLDALKNSDKYKY